ncbi:DUF5684 domain-containing protein [Mucilaginibacter flavidus]|uniref:DUF5684 domain-containing protein n=1 Tax=Mucilaginibacter flavidus TaxID=2949309 RepID=UPI0020932C04|nr:DUF5684 domain-containing protein [Mucilaginibacter flavidus]MCO5946122.1 DUF5684 domain-containing protein [Mucilaginibacter flavidus]
MQNYDLDSSSGGFAAAIMAMILAALIPILIVAVITIVGKWKVYEKAGKPGWAALIPVYTWIVMLEIVGKPVWWVILFFIPCVNIVFIIWTLNLVSKSFGQSEGFTIGLILLSFIFWPILGFGSYQYLGPSAAEAGGLRPRDPFNSPNVNNNYQDPFSNNPPPPQA